MLMVCKQAHDTVTMCRNASGLGSGLLAELRQQNQASTVKPSQPSVDRSGREADAGQLKHALQPSLLDRRASSGNAQPSIDALSQPPMR